MKVCIPFVPGIGDSSELRFVLRSHALYEPEWKPVLMLNREKDRPSWYTGESHSMEIDKCWNVHLDQFRKLTIFCTFNEDDHIYSPDDCFLLGPWPQEARYMAKTPVYRSLHGEAWDNTRKALEGSGVKLQYDFQLHGCQRRNGRKWLDIPRPDPDYGFKLPVMHRTLYGNHHLVDPTPLPMWDRKIINWDRKPEDKHHFFSTQDSMARDPLFVRWLNSRFPKRSPWEKV